MLFTRYSIHNCKSASIFAVTIHCLLLSTMPRITRARALQLISFVCVVDARMAHHLFQNYVAYNMTLQLTTSRSKLTTSRLYIIELHKINSGINGVRKMDRLCSNQFYMTIS